LQDWTQRLGKDRQDAPSVSRATIKYAEKLTNPILGTYRFRIGDYRVIFDLEGNQVVF